MEGAATTGFGSSILMIVIIFVVFYFLLIRPQKKQEKKTQQMRASLEVGDEIVTIGGIIGTVVVAKDDYLVIETGLTGARSGLPAGPCRPTTPPMRSLRQRLGRSPKNKRLCSKIPLRPVC